MVVDLVRDDGMGGGQVLRRCRGFLCEEERHC
jgi:hypothetical protein